MGLKIPFVAVLITGLYIASAGQDHTRALIDLLPAGGSVDDWYPSGPPEVATGEDLYLLINGGAEIYNEYGFVAAVYQTYNSASSKSINLEIYEMVDSSAAYGMFTFKTGQKGKAIDLGCQGWFASYYLNFWADNYLITVIGLDSSKSLIKGIERIAGKVRDQLTCRRLPPVITGYLPEENLLHNGIKYVKGSLGLFNQYFIDQKNIFGMREGVIGKYKDYMLMIFQYNSREESAKWYYNAIEHMKSGNGFSNCRTEMNYFQVTGQNSNTIYVRQYQTWILVAIGNQESSAKAGMEQIERHLGI